MEKAKMRPITSPLKCTPRTPRNSLQHYTAIRIPVTYPRTKSAFPPRSSSFVSNSKILLKRSNTTISASGREQDKVVHASDRHSTTMSNRPNRDQQAWWKLLHVNDVTPVLTVQTILPEITSQPCSSKPLQNSFQKKVYFEEKTNKMFLDKSKILYFKNCRSTIAENTESMSTLTEEPSIASDQLFRTFSNRSFMNTSKRSILHPRSSFYLRTPTIEKYGQRDAGASRSCECRLCSLEKEMKLVEKRERDDEIVNSIHIQLSQNLTKPWSEDSSSCPPSRPNSPDLDVQLEH